MKNIFLLLLLTAKISSAQNIAPYLSAPFPTGLTGSPTGNAIAWVFNNKGERNIYIAEAPLYKAHQLTHYEPMGIPRSYWLPQVQRTIGIVRREVGHIQRFEIHRCWLVFCLPWEPNTLHLWRRLLETRNGWSN